MICAGAGDCEGSHKLEKWRRSPSELPDEVGELVRLPGAHPADFPVLDHWRRNPPSFRGRTVTLSDIAAFMRDLLRSDPFGTGSDEVPFVDIETAGRLGMTAVAVTQRQLAFVVANALMGNGLEVGDGLEATMKRCSSRGFADARWFLKQDALEEELKGKASGAADIITRRQLDRRLRRRLGAKDDIMSALDELMAEADETTDIPTTAIPTTTRTGTTATTTSTTATTTTATTTTVTTTGAPPPQGFIFSLLSLLAVLSQELGSDDQGSVVIAAKPSFPPTDSWKQKLKESKLLSPTLCLQNAGGEDCGLDDFMSGGTDFQALTDIAGGSVGGAAGLCEIATTQEESLVQFYSEILAFSFFAAGPSKMLPTTVAFLGVRRYMSEISGQTSLGAPFGGRCGVIDAENWLNEDIKGDTVSVRLGERTKLLPVSRSAFVAVASTCAGCKAPECSPDDLINNNCTAQRKLFDEDLTSWFSAYEASQYHRAISGAFSSVVKRIGTGPWGAGDWHGDSQQSFLVVWLATSLLRDVKLDYYVYSRFCENAANQCLVLPMNECKSCLKAAYPWEGEASKLVSEKSCRSVGLQDAVELFQGKSAEELYKRLLGARGPPKSVFERLADDEGA